MAMVSAMLIEKETITRERENKLRNTVIRQICLVREADELVAVHDVENRSRSEQALAGGIILGVAQAIGAQINPGWQLLAGHFAFLLILALRPEGLFPKVKG